MGWNRTGGTLTMFPSARESAMPRRNSINCVARMMVGDTGGLDQLFLGEFGAEIAIVGAVDCDDRECDMVPDAGGGLRRE